MVSVIGVSSGGEPRQAFSDEFDDHFPVGSEEGNDAFFGREVLQGLIDGIDDFLHSRQPRWRRYRSIGPALLGAAMWINDEELIDKLGELSRRASWSRSRIASRIPSGSMRRLRRSTNGRRGCLFVPSPP